MKTWRGQVLTLCPRPDHGFHQGDLCPACAALAQVTRLQQEIDRLRAETLGRCAACQKKGLR
jgi:hypothetical protein